GQPLLLPATLTALLASLLKEPHDDTLAFTYQSHLIEGEADQLIRLVVLDPTTTTATTATVDSLVPDEANRHPQPSSSQTTQEIAAGSLCVAALFYQGHQPLGALVLFDHAPHPFDHSDLQALAELGLLAFPHFHNYLAPNPEAKP